MNADISVTGQGIYMVTPLSDNGSEWLDEHVGGDTTWLGDSLAVESGYVQGLCYGMIKAGLTVVKDAMRMAISDADGSLELVKS